MASSAPEQLWTGPRAAKEREDTIRGSRKWLGWSWRHINLLGGCNSRAKSSRIRSESSPQNGRPLGGLILGAAKGRISLVCGKSCGVLRTFVGRTPLFRYCTGRCWQSSSRAPSALSRTIVPPAEYSHRRRTMKTSRINRLRQPLAIYRRHSAAHRNLVWNQFQVVKSVGDSLLVRAPHRRSAFKRPLSASGPLRSSPLPRFFLNFLVNSP